ncbi:MAG TPA: sulfatase [Candidatus Hydrogenedentes bacterium]|nr:sulfatase [Candidatus Hydrogenedentota bacterium]
MRRRTFLKTAAAAGCSAVLWRGGIVRGAARPNIVWILAEDMSCHFGYQGNRLVSTSRVDHPLPRTVTSRARISSNRLVSTPRVDQLAAEGTVCSSAYVTAPVCSPSRSALITGMYQTSIGAHHHRSSRSPEAPITLPDPVQPAPELFRRAGYWVGNVSWPDGGPGKTDYNFVYADALYDGTDYTRRASDQPFFMQFQLRGGKFRNAQVPQPVSSDDVELPPYYPDHPVLRADWAQYLNSVIQVDLEVGAILDKLRADRALENTVIFFLTDHGISHARGKQFLYEEGTRVPLIVWGSEHIPSGAVRHDLISHIDITATSLALAGIPVPEWMEARPFLGPDARPREYVVSARDRCDETVDRIRSIRDSRFTYIRNGYPRRPHLQPNAYKDAKEILACMRELYAAGKLAGHPAERLFTVPRPAEELYDRTADPWELHNLAEDPAHAEQLQRMRSLLDRWIAETGDKGQAPEPETAYDAEMAVYLSQVNRSPEYVEQLRKNIAQMKAWAAVGM